MPIKRLALVASALLAMAFPLALSGAADAAGTWSAPYAPQGLAAIANGPTALRAMSCGTLVDDCLAVGEYADASVVARVFVIERTAGVWSDAVPLTGVTAAVGVTSVSARDVACSPDATCVAVGDVVDGATTSAFVTSGTDAIPIPGLAALQGSGHSYAKAIACPSAGNCSVTGVYIDSQSTSHMYVADQVNGVWGDATEISGLAGFTNGAWPSAISCGIPGECAIVGSGDDNAVRGFTVDRLNGVWGSATILPDMGPNTMSYLGTVSCPSATTCLAGGFIMSMSSRSAVVMSRNNGGWSAPMPVANVDSLGDSFGGMVGSIVCWAEGECVATGAAGQLGTAAVWVISMTQGLWGQAAFVPGISALGDGVTSSSGNLACNGSGTSCIVGGSYSAGTATESFASAFDGATWTTAHAILALVPTGANSYADPDLAACSATVCTVGGSIDPDTAGGRVAWFVDHSNGDAPTPTTTTTTTVPDEPVGPAFTG